jgi:hypothetical protein
VEPSHNRRGIILIHQAEPLYLVRLNTTGMSPGIPEGAVNDRLTHCHSFLRHGTHTVGLGIDFQGLLLYIRCVLCNRATSHRMWLFTTHRWSWMKKGYNLHLSPLKKSKRPPPHRAPISPLGNTTSPERPGQLPLAPITHT